MGNLENPDPPAPDGMTVKKTRHLRALYKKIKPDVIERVVNGLADGKTKVSDLRGLFEIMKNLEDTLNIMAVKAPVDEEDVLPKSAEQGIKSTLEALRGSIKDDQDEG